MILARALRPGKAGYAACWHKDRGRSVWDRELGSLKAANFGSQGSGFKSLLWRMQNGELDGYRAKLFVLNLGAADQITNPFDDRTAEFVAGCSSLIGEIRAPQPQAKLLLLAGSPRGQLTRESWREIAEANAGVFAQLADDETVFYADFGERFYQPDGPYNGEYWGMPGPPALALKCRYSSCGPKSFSPGSTASFADTAEPRCQ